MIHINFIQTVALAAVLWISTPRAVLYAIRALMARRVYKETLQYVNAAVLNDEGAAPIALEFGWTEAALYQREHVQWPAILAKEAGRKL